VGTDTNASGRGARRAQRIVFPAIRRVAWEDYEVPAVDALAPTQVLVRNASSLVSAGTEMAIYSGAHIGFATPGATYPRMPFRPGYAAGGVVVAAGAAVSAFRPGDRVCGAQRHEPWSVVDTAREMLLPLPDGVTFEQGGLARLAGIAMQGVRLARVQLGDHGVVFGQGLVGQFARQFLVIDGAATAIAVDPVDARLEVAARHGATHTVNPQRAPAAERVAAITAGHGADVVIEATGSPAVAVDALKVAAELGRVVLLGSPRGRAEIDLYHDIHSKGVSLIGAHVRTAPGTANAHYRWTRDEQQLLALELMRQGRLVTDGLVTHRVPAAAALDVYETLLAGPQDRLGVIITWPED